MFSNLKKPAFGSGTKSFRKTVQKEPYIANDDLPPPPPFLLEVNDYSTPCSPTEVRPEKKEKGSHEERKKKKEKKKKDRLSRNVSDSSGADTVRGRLKLLMLGRPSIETLQEKGIIKENVFGCPLVKLCANENTTIPNFVKLCIEEIDKRGLDTDGLYRVSGNLSDIMKLRYHIDRDEPVNLSDPQWSEIHVVSGALKMFLRELPEPVIPFNCYHQFINACYEKDDSKRLERYKTLIRSLPKINYDTLFCLMEHFWRVVEHSSKNRMQVQNIAIVFGPTLLAIPPENGPQSPGSCNMALNLHYQSQIVENILSERAYLFW